MKLLIEVDLDKMGHLRNLWEVLPDALHNVGVAAAEAGALEGAVHMPYARSKDGQEVGSWRVE